MSRQILLLPAASLLMVLAACTQPVEAPVVQQPTVAVFEAPQAKVWNAIVSTIGLDYPIQAIERDSGLISTRPTTMVLPAGRWALGCDDANDFVFPWNQLRMDLRVLVEDKGQGRTQVTMLPHYEAYKQRTWPRAWTIVASNGTLETELLKTVQERLQIPSAK